MSSTRLPWPIDRALTRPMPDDPKGLYRGIESRRRRKLERKRLARVAIGTSALCAAIAAVIYIGVPIARPIEDAGPLRLANRTPLSSSIQPQNAYRPLQLSDGSWITVAAGARLDVLQSSARGFTVALRQGRARFDVKPNGPRFWRVECGPMTIEVVGTSFQVERTSTVVRVSVARGAVLVRGQEVSDRVQRLNAGQALAIKLSAEPAVVAQSSSPPATSQTHALAVTPLDTAEVTWQQAARRSQWSAAWRKLSVLGIGRESERATRVQDLLLLADVARLSGHPREATVPLERIVNQYASDPRAALASFTLGTMRLDQLSEPAGAASDIARAITLGLPRALAEDAHVRLVEAYARAGDAERARGASRDYRQRYPQGRRAREVDGWSPR